MNNTNKVNKYTNKNFEEIKHIDENGGEYWEARELMLVLNYIQWRRFEQVIDKARESCDNSNNVVSEHFSKKVFDRSMILSITVRSDTFNLILPPIVLMVIMS